MAPELEKYFNNYFDLFRNEGWKQLTEELKNNALQINDLQTVKDVEDMNVRKGQLVILANILNLENTINTSYEQALEEEKAEEDV